LDDENITADKKIIYHSQVHRRKGLINLVKRNKYSVGGNYRGLQLYRHVFREGIINHFGFENSLESGDYLDVNSNPFPKRLIVIREQSFQGPTRGKLEIQSEIKGSLSKSNKDYGN